MSDLDLLYTDVEDDQLASVRDLLADRCDPTAVTAVCDGDRSFVDGLWKALAVDLGLAGLLVPEGRGGAGASAHEAAVVLEELGRSVAPAPFLTSSVVATTILLDAEGELLAALAAGERIAALAASLTTATEGVLPAVRADAHGRLTGTVTSVVNFATKPTTSAAGPLDPNARTDMPLPDGRPLEKTASFDPAQSPPPKTAATYESATTSSRTICIYRITATIENIAVDVTLVGRVPSWRPETGHMYFGEGDQQKLFAWLRVLPAVTPHRPGRQCATVVQTEGRR
jgi:hypothetical protein